jgi:hypothetical protein
MQEAYKVVSRLHGGYVSSTTMRYHAGSNLVLWYDPEKWVRPKVGKLFVFRTMLDAGDFVEEMPIEWNLEIFPCDTQGLAELRGGFPCIGAHTAGEIARYWDDVRDRPVYPNPAWQLVSPPWGTMVCDALRLRPRQEVRNGL